MIRVRIITIGDIYSELNTARLKEWKSDLFEFCDIIKHDLQHQTDLAWGYSDSLLEKILPKPADFLTNADLSFFVFDVPLEDNYFSRIISGNRVLISYYEIKDFLTQENIPLENFILKLAYSYVLLYMTDPIGLSMEKEILIAHDLRRGCLYDMCGNKKEIVYSTVVPSICNHCKDYLSSNGISDAQIRTASKELKHIRRSAYYSIVAFLKKHPILSIIISGGTAFILNMISDRIYDLLNFYQR